MPGDPQTSPGDSERNQLSNLVSGAHSPPLGVWPLVDTVMANRTDASVPFTSYEYYLDYIDLIPVDEKKLKANKHSIVIALWLSLATFVVLLFFILLYMSWSGSPQVRHSPHTYQIGSWIPSFNFPLCLRRASLQTAEEPGSRAGPDQWAQQQSASASPPGPLALP